MGKFTTAEVSESQASEIFAPKAASKEANRPTSPADSVDDAFTLKTTQTRRKTRTPRDPKPVIQSVSEAPANYNLWAQLLIGSTNTVVVTWLGQECAMERREAEMLEPPVARILARLPTSQAQKMATFIDPMVILIALGTWGNRIVRIQRAKKSDGIPVEELMRARGETPPRPFGGTEASSVEPEQQPAVVVPEDLPGRVRVPVNPNGVPTAITSQMGEV